MTVKDDTNLGEEKPESKAGESAEEKEVSEGKNVVDPGSQPEEKQPEETLESLLKEEKFKINKTKLHPEVVDGDFTAKDGIYDIHAKHIADDIDKLFGENANPKLFFSIYKSTPKKAEVIAKACGWRSSHYAKAAIEDLIAAKTQDEKDAVLKADFPEWVWADDVDKPFRVTEKKPEVGTPVAKFYGHFQWSNEELSRAVNDYVADNKQVSKDSILKNAKVAKLLEEFSGFQRNGKPLDAYSALKYVVPLAIPAEEPKKTKDVSIGGNRNSAPKTSATGMTDGMKAMLSQSGYGRLIK